MLFHIMKVRILFLLSCCLPILLVLCDMCLCIHFVQSPIRLPPFSHLHSFLFTALQFPFSQIFFGVLTTAFVVPFFRATFKQEVYYINTQSQTSSITISNATQQRQWLLLIRKFDSGQNFCSLLTSFHSTRLHGVNLILLFRVQCLTTWEHFSIHLFCQNVKNKH